MHSDKLTPKIAYFSMEFGLDARLPIYAGGLGILAGDFLKSARELNLPLTGIGILWRRDYTEQTIGEDGYPHDAYPEIDFSSLKDTGIKITVTILGEEVTCKIFLADQFYNAPLYLLDTGYPGFHHGWITSKLYESNLEIRVAQEIILGVGGVRALKALGINIDIYHFNEGHAVMAGLELIKNKMRLEKLSFENAWKEIRQKIVFLSLNTKKK